MRAYPVPTTTAGAVTAATPGATRAEATRVRRDGENVDMACWSSPRENGRSLSPSSETPCVRARAITSRSSPLVSDRQYRWCQSKRRSTCALSSLWDPHQCLSGQGSEIVKGQLTTTHPVLRLVTPWATRSWKHLYKHPHSRMRHRDKSRTTFCGVLGSRWEPYLERRVRLLYWKTQLTRRVT